MLQAEEGSLGVTVETKEVWLLPVGQARLGVGKQARAPPCPDPTAPAAWPSPWWSYWSARVETGWTAASGIWH